MEKFCWKLDRKTQIHSAGSNGRSAQVKCLTRLIYVVTLSTEDNRQGEIIGHTLRQGTELAEHFLETGEGFEDVRPVGTAARLYESLAAELCESLVVNKK